MIRNQETLDQLLHMIQQFVKNELMPREHEVAEKDEMPQDIIDQMKALGLFGLTIPEEYGGLGLTMEEELYVAFEIGRTSPAFRSIFGTIMELVQAVLLLTGLRSKNRSIYHAMPVVKSSVHFA